MRAVVRWAVASLLCAVAVSADVLHLADGSRLEGTLTFCDDESCSIDKRRIPRPQITKITLRDLPSPPSLREAGVILTDGSTRRGAFTGLTLGYVEIDGEEIDRETVAVIVVEAPATDVDTPPGENRDAPSPAQPPGQEPPPPPPGAPPSNFPAPPPRMSDGTPRRGALWIGTMDGRGWGTVHEIFSDLRISVQARLREYISPLVILKDGKIKSIGTMTQLEPEGTVVRNVYRCRSWYLTVRERECLEKDHKAWKACRDAATCRGEAFDLCGPDPMSGSH